MKPKVFRKISLEVKNQMTNKSPRARGCECHQVPSGQASYIPANQATWVQKSTTLAHLRSRASGRSMSTSDVRLITFHPSKPHSSQVSRARAPWPLASKLQLFIFRDIWRVVIVGKSPFIWPLVLKRTCTVGHSFWSAFLWQACGVYFISGPSFVFVVLGLPSHKQQHVSRLLAGLM